MDHHLGQIPKVLELYLQISQCPIWRCPKRADYDKLGPLLAVDLHANKRYNQNLEILVKASVAGPRREFGGSSRSSAWVR